MIKSYETNKTSSTVYFHIYSDSLEEADEAINNYKKQYPQAGYCTKIKRYCIAQPDGKFLSVVERRGSCE